MRQCFFEILVNSLILWTPVASDEVIARGAQRVERSAWSAARGAQRVERSAWNAARGAQHVERMHGALRLQRVGRSTYFD